MTPNARLSEQISLLATIDPSSAGVGSVSTGWVSAANHERFMAQVNTGALGSGGTVDAKLQQATDSSGTGAKDVANKAITQITANNKQALIDLRADELDANGGFSYFRLTMTIGVAASLVGAAVIGSVARSEPASALNQTATNQIVQ